MTVPGVNVICAAIFLAAVGDIRRFKDSRQAVAYLGLDPRVYQSGSSPARGGRISKQGSPQARWALVEAARSVARQASSSRGRVSRTDWTPWPWTRAGSRPGARPRARWQGPLTAVSCPSESLCVAGDVAGNILSSTNPTGGLTAWSSAAVSPQQSIQSVSCPSISLCVAVGYIGNVLTSTDPTGGASGWTKTTIDQGSFFDTVSCPAVSLCVAGGGGTSIDGEATILTSTNPTGGASSWSSAPVASGNEIVNAVSCPSDSLCVATTNKGDVLTSTNPTRGTSAWTKIDQGSFFDTVSCPVVSLCVAGGGGNVLTSTDPTGGASAWTNTAIEQGNDVYAISCPSVFLCAAADQSGNILTSTDPTGGANAWTSATVDIPGCAPPSNPCISEHLYARDDQGTRILDAAAPGRGNSIGNVALGGDSLILTWTHDGAQRQLQLR
jgi:hypothetical protein